MRRASMRPCAFAGSSAWRRTPSPVPVDRRELGEGVGAVRLDRQHVVRAVRLDDGPRGVAGRVQRVQGEHAAAQIDVLQQGAQRGGLAALVAAAEARDGTAGVGDQGHRLEVRGVVGVPVRAADALAVRGQRRHVRVLRETRRRPPRQHLPQRVRVGVHQHPADGRVRRRHPAPRRPGRATRPARAAPSGPGSSRSAPSPPGRAARRAAPARRSPAPSRGGACGPARGARPAPPRTGRAANAARRACSAPAPTGTTTPGGPPGPPAAAARRGAAPARTSPSAPRAGPCTSRCAARSPSSGPPRVQFDAA